jgi:hypothetical protein
MVAEEAIDDLGGGRGEEGASGFRIVGSTVGGEKDAKMVVDFRGGGEGGAAAAAGVALLHGQGGGETFHRIDGRCGQPFEMEAGMGGETFKIPALAFGVDGIERERGFAGAGGPGEDDETVFGNVEVEAGEIMLASTADPKQVAGSAHGRRGRHRAGPGLGGRGGRGIDVDAPVAAIEADMAVGEGEEGVVPSHADVVAGMELGAALADENGAGEDELSAVPFHAETLAMAVAAVACRSLTFFMCHDELLV